MCTLSRVIVFVSVLFSSMFLAQAQESISFSNPDISFEFKRCTSSGATAYIDFLVTNNSDSDINGDLLTGAEPCSGFEGYYTAAYDDEGNVYRCQDQNYKIAGIAIGGSASLYGSGFRFDLPKGIPVKMRVTLTGLDQYATKISLMKITFRDMKTPAVYGIALLEARGLPITR